MNKINNHTSCLILLSHAHASGSRGCELVPYKEAFCLAAPGVVFIEAIQLFNLHIALVLYEIIQPHMTIV